jgi:signal transduction histidine kinase
VRIAAARRLAWGLLAFGIVLAGAGLALSALNGERGGLLSITLFTVTFLGFGLTGSLVASRRPDNSIGWLLLGTALGLVTLGLSTQYATYAVQTDPGALPGGVWAAWVISWAWGAVIGPMVTFLFLLFPDGHVPSRRWRPVAWVAGVDLAIIAVAGMVNPNADSGLPAGNPIGIEAAGKAVDALIGVAFLILLVVALLSVASLIVRFRRSRGDERQQIKLFAFAAGLLAGWLTLTSIGEAARISWLVDSPLITVLSIVAFLALPAAVGAAILKYRLYELDLVIRKTVVFGLLALFMTLVYAAVVGGIGALVGSTSNTTLSFVAAAALAVLFQPARERARRIADRLVYGKRATPYEVLAEFSGRVGEAYSTDDVLPRMAQLLAEGTGATSATVWLRVGGEVRPTASWPEGRRDDPLALEGETLPTFQNQDAVEVQHQGQLLGALTVTMPHADPMNPAKEKLVRDLAGQAGLVLRNVRLIEELRASRQRLVAAQDEERRRLERNLHDGAQQQLVALSVRLRLAESLAERDPAETKAMLSALQAETGEALENLRDLARGIYPPLLADQGLPAALQAQARKAPVPVEVRSDGVGRLPKEVEAAVYFCCLEALQNVAKYAHATHAEVRLSASGEELAFEVTDDGDGFDTGTMPPGSGLQGMADRLEALGGILEVRSEPGAGTTVTGRIAARPLAPIP